ncbi:MAG: hypothetical protein A2939_02040 [Parcubacteria group bacterium RIFCSPLOWO2_01_FULL_48_18]|nr:MAG: hypothetical protein A2939_02040 [Parcubacteria group bacterium RIFCSPLOWO2_01_FULL_48_18]
MRLQDMIDAVTPVNSGIEMWERRHVRECRDGRPVFYVKLVDRSERISVEVGCDSCGEHTSMEYPVETSVEIPSETPWGV